MPRQGVIFDMDGVLVDSFRPHLRSWGLLAEEMGRSITEEQFAGTFGKTSREIIREWFRMEDAGEVRRLDDRKEKLYRELIRGRIPAMPGAGELIRSLHADGFCLSVGSSGPPENVDLVCDELGLRPFLTAIVTGADVQRGKPDPQVFETAAARMGVSPSSCVVVEDAPVGLVAARRAGMCCIGLLGTHPAEALSAADRVIRRLNELCPEAVRQILHAGRSGA